MAIYLGGSRHLVPNSPAWVACQQFARAAGVLHVGCCVGADQAALLAASPLVVFAQFAAGGAGACSFSAVQAVQAAAAGGASVRWLAGGPLSLPLSARLIRRSLAALAGCSSAVFFAPGSGSLSVAARAIKAGQPVSVWSVFPPSIPGARLAGQISEHGVSFWQFQPKQNGLF